MHLIFIYGPPGVGKLTTGRELQKITGFKLFHNQLSYDLVNQVVPRKSPLFWKTTTRLRLEMIELGCKAKTPGMIFTFCYSQDKTDAEFVKKIISVVKKHRGSVHFVQLLCHRKEHLSRIRNPSRKQFAKITTVKVLKEVEKKNILDQPIPFVKSLMIDNSRLSAKAVASKIMKELRFSRV